MIIMRDCRAVYRNFAQGGQIWGMDKRGGGGGAGAEAYVGCYTLHLLGRARMTQGGSNAPPPPPPLNTALGREAYSLLLLGNCCSQKLSDRKYGDNIPTANDEPSHFTSFAIC